MIASIVISILTSILGAFLSTLFKKWFGLARGTLSQENRGVLQQALSDSKPDFLVKVRRSFWLGPRREQWASALYDRAQARLSGEMVELSANPSEVAKFCTDGLEKLTPAELAPKQALGPGALRFKILPNGLVKGGSVSYEIDPDGTVHYEAHILAGKWFVTIPYDYSGKYPVDTALLDPKRFVVGQTIIVGKLQLRVASMGQTTALLALSLPGYKATGTAILSTTSSLATLLSMDATASIAGFSVMLGLRKV